jgi:hypothetical protein
VVVIATKGNVLALEFENPVGVGLALLSTLLWAGYWILNTKNKADPVLGMLLGFLIALPFAAIICAYEGASWAQISWKGWAAVTYVGLFEMSVTFVLWLSAMKLTSNTARISNLIFTSPYCDGLTDSANQTQVLASANFIQNGTKKVPLLTESFVVDSYHIIGLFIFTLLTNRMQRVKCATTISNFVIF